MRRSSRSAHASPGARLAALFFGCVLVVAAFGQDEPPDALVKRVTSDLLTTWRNEPDILTGDTGRLIQLAEEKVLPYFDFPRMTALSVGVGWRSASDAQKARLTEGFRELLVHTYANAISGYKYEQQDLEYLPLRMQPGADKAVVRSLFKRPGAEPMEIAYRLQKKADGWKVYDVIVGGVSLVTTYRNTFAEELRNGGVDGLIELIAAKNRALQQPGDTS